MAKVSNREKILCEGMKVVHQVGYANASVRDIVAAAGVPQGSFTNHFASKEAFGLEVIDLYFAKTREGIAETLRNDAIAPLERLRTFVGASRCRANQSSMRNGCLFGNFAAEVTDGSDAIRAKLLEVFAEIESGVVYCLKAAVKSGDVPKSLDCEETAGFIVSSLQGANLLAKTVRSAEPIERFERLLFSKILK